jgi:hypothetical protein
LEINLIAIGIGIGVHVRNSVGELHSAIIIPSQDWINEVVNNDNQRTLTAIKK